MATDSGEVNPVRVFFLVCWLAVVGLGATATSHGQDDRLRDLERRISRLEQDQKAASGWNTLTVTLGSGAEALAVGVFCALWARRTGRDPWLWLAAGTVFNILVLLAVWSKHEEDQKKVVKVAVPEL